MKDPTRNDATPNGPTTPAAAPPGASHEASQSTMKRLLTGGEEAERNNPIPKPASHMPAVPTLELPKGGGAIRGIGEKFSTNLATGTGGMSIPLALSPGRGGFGPSLALTYSTGAGNGPFGLGWSLPLASVSRRTDRHVPRYRDEGEEADTFLLADEEELVPTLDEVGARVTRTTETHRIERYRPRVDGSNLRIERWVRLTDGDVHWRATSPDNVTTVYGQSAEARVADGADAKRVFRWLVEEVRDDRGNVMRYEYKPEDLAGVSAAVIYERNRVGHAACATQRYLKRVLYGNRVPDVAGGWLFEAVFDYGEHTDAEQPYDEPTAWPVRPDAFSTHRSGFELRTWRLCERVLMFHRLEGDGTTPVLVRATEFDYTESPVAQMLTAARQWGYRTGSVPESSPDVTFEYAEAAFDQTLREATADALAGLPEGLDGTRFRWVDLDLEGIAGILTEQSGTFLYKRNLGDGCFTAARPVGAVPMSAGTGASQLTDLGGDHGLQMVTQGPAMQGFFERTEESAWAPFVPFGRPLNVSMDDPNVRLLDLDGDGQADVLVAEDQVFRWYPSKGREGFDAPRAFPQAVDEERGPRLVFADGTQSIYLADMDGDGLTDLVRLRDGEVCYWPNQGHGRFGAKVTMADAPVFDAQASFRHDRVRLADLDGSGTTDLVYVGSDRTRAWINRAGNRWSEAVELTGVPRVDDVTQVAVLDLLGQGTGCVVISSPKPGDPPLRYVDLLGGVKPYVMVRTANSRGATTEVTYAPSTKFYLEDRRAGRPWVTKLPFPVQVIERVETQDLVSGARHVARYAYHHGFYDRGEKEFRGFACVEQWDEETMPPQTGLGVFPAEVGSADPVLWIPPVHTRTWFHTGAFLQGPRLDERLAEEFYAEPGAPPLVMPPVLPEGLPPDESREALRALRGATLRQEVYADDGTAAQGVPCGVTVSRSRVRMLQRKGAQAHCVVRVEPVETVTMHTERVADDPRVTHQLTLAVDEHGFVTRSATVAYARRAATEAAQQAVVIVVQEASWIHRTAEDDWHRLGVPQETRAYEVVLDNEGRTALYTVGELNAALTAGVTEVDYESLFVAPPPPPPVPRRRLIARSRVFYASEPPPPALPTDPPTPPTRLAAGAIERRALPYEEQTLVFTPGLLTLALGDALPATEPARSDALTAMQTDGGYAVEDGLWWIASGHVTFDPRTFWQPAVFTDPFGAETKVSWSAHALWPESVEDAVHNVVTAVYDPVTLAPREVTDPNGNRTQVAFDVLGRVVATWTRGKTTEDVGDSDALPGTLMEYHDALAVSGGTVTPPYVRMRARQAHRAPDVAASYEEQYVYSDGFGRVVQTKVKCEPEAGSTDVRWLGTGRTIYNNKGLPVKQYDPFFATGPGFETETWLVTRGHTAVLHYDPLGRLVRTDLPNGTFTRETFTPWAQTSWDANDTVLASRWYAERAPTSSASAAEKDAAEKAAAHAETPSVVHFDTLGRPYRAVADLGGGVTYTTTVEHDVAGRALRVTDARGRVVQTDVVDMAGRVLKRTGLDTGTDRTLPERAGQPMCAWTANGFAIVRTYDALRRPVAVTAQKGSMAVKTVQWTRYGEEADAAVEHNLRGRVWRQYDGAGLVTTAACDFKGNVLEATRRLAADYAGTPAWNTVAGAESESLRETAESGLLADEVFTTATTYDARNRSTQVTPPRATNLSGTELFATRVRAVLPRYNVAGLLDGVDVVLGDDEADPTAVVTAIVYNERRQRTSITHGNGVTTAYEYDAVTQRLARLYTTAGGSTWQDLRYTYDPVGNITRITDEAQQTLYFGGTEVPAGSDYTYDALYRLIAASGRELAALTIPSGDLFETLSGIPHDNDVDAVRRYTEQYEYDAVGNFERMRHRIGSGPDEAWVREYLYAPGTNRLVETTTGGGTTTGTFDYDDHGNMIAMSSLPGGLDWNWREELSAAHKSADCTVHFQYDASGQRVRKVQESRSGTTVTGTKERLYLGGWELYRERAGTTVQRAVQTCAVVDGEKQVALIETRTVTAGSSSLVERIRYQYPNHLGTACLELDVDGDVMTYEEYLPYGQVAYSVRRADTADEPRRYRYTGMEQDETGLQYHSARYYASWLGRWTSPDPIGIKSGLNLYCYSQCDPVGYTDPGGTQQAPAQTRQIDGLGTFTIAPTAPRIGMAPSESGYLQSAISQADFTRLEQAWNAFTSGDASSHLRVDYSHIEPDRVAEARGHVVDAFRELINSGPDGRALFIRAVGLHDPQAQGRDVTLQLYPHFDDSSARPAFDPRSPTTTETIPASQDAYLSGGARGSGSGSTIRLDMVHLRSAGSHLRPVSALQSFYSDSVNVDPPRVVTLGHELIHAMRFRLGVGVRDGVPVNPVNSLPTGTGANRIDHGREEELTGGFSADDRSTAAGLGLPTEYSIALQAGVSPRRQYVGDRTMTRAVDPAHYPITSFINLGRWMSATVRTVRVRGRLVPTVRFAPIPRNRTPPAW